ncbi:unnamed protein product [Ilex paraguariensis]|uniref:Uncharacterized protein n=1 Tax=Ilex paraguariensis TaxID=185542 RepID=A0ABC8UCK5_9AQUA
MPDPSFKSEESRFSTHPSIDLLSSGKRAESKPKESKPISHVMRENIMPSSTVTRTYVLPQPPVVEDAKENVAVGGGDRIVGFSCPRKANMSSTVARKLSMGSSVVPQTEPREIGGTNKENVQELDTISEKPGVGNRILVFL